MTIFLLVVAFAFANFTWAAGMCLEEANTKAQKKMSSLYRVAIIAFVVITLTAAYWAGKFAP